ncbi:MAG: hypothetical protein GTO40_02975 [Deltaproteobacteria bacterium]|nr:hypothetical protein [Deltaproteobacteria bacterium]
MEHNVYVRNQYGTYVKRGLASLIDCLLLGFFFVFISFSSTVTTAIVKVVIFFGYMIGLKYALGFTLGYYLLQMKIISTNGANPTIQQIAVRQVASMFSLLGLGLGFLWIAIDKNKQAWHDKIASTYVIRPKSTPVGTTEIARKQLVRTNLFATVAVISIVLLVGVSIGTRMFLKDSEAYQSAQQYLQTNERVREELGKPVKIGWFFTGMFANLGDRGKAVFLMRVKGNKGMKTITVLSDKAQGKWKTTMAGYTDQAGKFVDITKPKVVVAKKPEPEVTETVAPVRRRPRRQVPIIKEPKKITYSRIDVEKIKSYTGRWVKIMMKDGVEREGKILGVADEELQIEQSFNFGSMKTAVKFHEIVDLLVSDS